MKVSELITALEHEDPDARVAVLAYGHLCYEFVGVAAGHLQFIPPLGLVPCVLIGSVNEITKRNACSLFAGVVKVPGEVNHKVSATE